MRVLLYMGKFQYILWFKDFYCRAEHKLDFILVYGAKHRCPIKKIYLFFLIEKTIPRGSDVIPYRSTNEIID